MKCVPVDLFTLMKQKKFLYSNCSLKCRRLKFESSSTLNVKRNFLRPSSCACEQKTVRNVYNFTDHVGQDALINASGSQPISLRMARQLVWQFLSV